ncbi:MAG: substrate-binding domain-containing protein [Oscillospiraceae bacterium]|nr:substrate-binding domain-containing protein [Oscillospiraceae bacterium]
MRTSKKLLPLLLAAALLLGGCAAPSRGASAAQHKVWLVAKSTDTAFWLSAFGGANAAKAEYNVDLTIVGPETEEDYEQQNAYIAEAVEQGAEAIVFSAISYTENAAAIDAAADAGLKIVVIDSDVDSRKVGARIGTDNVQAGRMTAAAVLDTEEESLCVGIVNFDLGSRNGQERELGLRQALEEDARVTGAYTVNVQASATAAQTGVEILLAEHPDVNALVGLNEPLAVGVALAVERLGLSGKVRVVGFDTNVQCVDLMRSGTVSALIAQNPYAMGYLGVETAWQLLEGQSFDPDRLIDTATTIISAENMFTIESQKALFSFG